MSEEKETFPQEENKAEGEVLKLLAITHGPGCPDGAGSAYVIDTYFRTIKSLKTITHIRVNPDSALKTIKKKMERINREGEMNFYQVVSCDVGYTGKDIKELIDMFPGIIILDHHISSFKDIVSFFNQKKASIDFNLVKTMDDCRELDLTLPGNYVYDPKKSGVGLAWRKFFYAGRKIPKILAYIEDKDLWTPGYNKGGEYSTLGLPYSKEINEGIWHTLDMNPVVYNPETKEETYEWDKWDEMIEKEEESLEYLKRKGEVLLEATRKRVEELGKKFSIFEFEVPGGENEITRIYNCAELNTAEHISELGNHVVNQKDKNGNYKCEIALMWRYDSEEDKYICSMRSRGDVDVSTICKKYGGGGHVPAAAMSIKNIFEIIKPEKYQKELRDKEYMTELKSLRSTFDILMTIIIFIFAITQGAMYFNWTYNDHCDV